MGSDVSGWHFPLIAGCRRLGGSAPEGELPGALVNALLRSRGAGTSLP